MTERELKLHLCERNISAIKAMQMIQDNMNGIIFVVDDERKLLGSVTDGDIRRWLIQTGDITGKINDFVFKKTRYIYENQRENARNFMRNEGIFAVPVLSDEKKIIDIIIDTDVKSWKRSIRREVLRGIPVIIMAGGKGTRLYPYTKILPKPLIPIGEVPILERILEQFYHFGVQEFWLTLNYKKEMIKSYFAELHHEYMLHYIEEDVPLGTAGGLGGGA